MSLRRYPEYKDSGVEWLADVPVHWSVDRLKASITSCKNGIWGDDPSGDANDIDCVRVADFDRVRFVVDADVPTKRAVPKKDRVGRLLDRGDLLLEKSGGGEKQPVGQVVLYDRDASAVCSNFVAKVSLADGMAPRFWMYQHAAAYARGVNVGSIKQTSGIQNLDQSQYFNERGVFPPEDEQVLIAAFLDRETGKIDALIAAQEKLIALLAEKRQVTISHAVTKGLNPNAPMKDSGVVWLGEVPTHWAIKRVKHLVKEGIAGPYGSSLTKSMYSASGYRVYGQQQVIPGDFSVGDYYISEEQFAEMSRYQVRPNDVLISVMGTIGRSAVVPQDAEAGIINPRLVLYRVIERLICPKYLQVFLNNLTSQRYFSLAAQGTTMEGLNMGSIGELHVALPPLHEQQEILQFVQSEGAKLDLISPDSQP
ncbi:restriction endonuclease subunit S [Xanthomonas cerealis pv. cerealis]|uniref:Restriction endonuclease subunit S n=1 Tax=Xanthomonas cerealis pv. cerealis TaxID=152263 RepID=A0A514EE42_9XANT|nr:restriction endonuclease subunit S [Xanthomonas translucens]QDI04292.1 restriction endonuclease subunit S [Xanthomonas translucens pv. cerealis]